METPTQTPPRVALGSLGINGKLFTLADIQAYRLLPKGKEGGWFETGNVTALVRGAMTRCERLARMGALEKREVPRPVPRGVGVGTLYHDEYRKFPGAAPVPDPAAELIEMQSSGLAGGKTLAFARMRADRQSAAVERDEAARAKELSSSIGDDVRAAFALLERAKASNAELQSLNQQRMAEEIVRGLEDGHEGLKYATDYMAEVAARRR